MKLKINDDKGYNERRSIAVIHRKGREERKAEGEKSLRPLRSLRLIDLHGIPTAQGNKAMVVFRTGLTGSTGCVLSFDPVMWSRGEADVVNGSRYLNGNGRNTPAVRARRYWIRPPTLAADLRLLTPRAVFVLLLHTLYLPSGSGKAALRSRARCLWTRLWQS